MTEIPDYTDFCWPVDPACLGNEWEDLAPEVQDRATAQATSALYRLCLGRVGGCPTTVRPCRQNRCEGFPLDYGYDYWASGWMYPFMRSDGSVFNCCGSSGNCGCSVACSITPGGFVGTVSEIKIDGTAQTLTDFKVMDNESIVYQGSGDCPFPTTQDLSKPDTAAGTFSVTYLAAYDVDGEGAYAAGVLAMEFAKACSPGGKCRLPTGVTQLVRQGVSYTIASGLFPGGKTGIREVDSFIGRYNPAGLTVQPSIIIPGHRGSVNFS